MISVWSCTDATIAPIESNEKIVLRAADPPCYDAPYVPGVINITNRYVNAQGECCVVIQFNRPLTQPGNSNYELCLTNTATGAPLSPPKCFTFPPFSNVSNPLCYALTGNPMKITVLNTSNNKIVTCNSYGKEYD